MTLEQLRYFQAAARFEHMGKAARSIPISVSVVSQAVKQLEEELGCVLFTRENRRVRLTTHGSRLLASADDLLRQAEALKANFAGKAPELSGHYRIGASHSLATMLVTPVVAEMQKKAPGLTIDLHSLPTWGLVDAILAGRIDFGVGFSPLPHPQLEMEEIFRGQSLVAARKNHPIFAHGDRNAYKHLGEYPATMHMATDKIFMVRHHPFLRESKLDRNITFSFDSDYVAVENLKRSDHWALLLDIVVERHAKELRVVQFPAPSKAGYTVQLIRHRARRSDPVLTAAYERMREACAQWKKSP